MAATSSAPSGSLLKLSGCTSIFRPTTVASECTLLSVRLLRLQLTCRVQPRAVGDRSTRRCKHQSITTRMQATHDAVPASAQRGPPTAAMQQPHAWASAPRRALLSWPRLDGRMPPARKMASSRASSTVASGAAASGSAWLGCICRPAEA